MNEFQDVFSKSEKNLCPLKAFNFTAMTSKLPRTSSRISVISACPYSVVTLIRIKISFQYIHHPYILVSKIFIKLTDPLMTGYTITGLTVNILDT